MISSLEDFKVYNLSMEAGEKVWAVVMSWDYFEKEMAHKGTQSTNDTIRSIFGNNDITRCDRKNVE